MKMWHLCPDGRSWFARLTYLHTNHISYETLPLPYASYQQPSTPSPHPIPFQFLTPLSFAPHFFFAFQSTSLNLVTVAQYVKKKRDLKPATMFLFLSFPFCLISSFNPPSISFPFEPCRKRFKETERERKVQKEKRGKKEWEKLKKGEGDGICPGGGCAASTHIYTHIHTHIPEHANKHTCTHLLIHIYPSLSPIS